MQVSAALESRHEPALPPGFGQFYADHYDFLWRCARRMGVAADDVEDLVQECFVVALRRFADFDPRGRARPSTWLFAILRNVQRNHARSTRRRVARLELLALSSEAEPPIGYGADSSLAGRLLDDFLTTLDEDKRAAFVLAEIEGMTGPELARALELNLNTVNSRVRAARRAFGRHFEGPDLRESARVELSRSARARAPEDAVRRGLPAIALLAGAPLSTKVGFGLGALGSKWIAGLIFTAASLGAAAIVASAQPRASGSKDGASISRASIEPPPIRELALAGTSETPLESPPPVVIEAAAAEPSTPDRARSKPPEPTALQRIAEGREALVAGQPERSLAWVEGRTFPAEFEGLRIALEVAALCRLDRQAVAQRRAESWRAKHPNDPTSAELHEICWSE